MNARRYTRLTGADRQRAVELAKRAYAVSGSVPEVVAELAAAGVEVSAATVRTYLREAGVTLPAPGWGDRARAARWRGRRNTEERS